MSTARWVPVALALTVVCLMAALALPGDRINDASAVEIAILHHVLPVVLDNNGVVWLGPKPVNESTLGISVRVVAVLTGSFAVPVCEASL